MEVLTDLVSELAVLSACINHGTDCYLDISEFVQVDTFTDEQAQALWQCLSEIYKGETKKADLPSILTTAKQIGLEVFFNSDEKQKTLARILRFQIEPENAIGFAKKLKKLQISRNLSNRLDLAKKQISQLTGGESLDHIVNCAESPIFEITNEINGTNNEVKKLGDTIDDYLEFLKENKGKSIGLSTGFPEYDRAIGGGLRRGSVGVICARMKVGKSAYVACIGLHVAQKLNVPVLAIDTEMSYEEHNTRLLANLTSINREDIENGTVFDGGRLEKKINEAKDVIKVIPYHHISVAGKSFNEIISVIRRWIVRNVGYDKSGHTNPCLIFYDYLKIMDAEEVRSMQEYQVLGLQMTQLHNLAVQFDVPILAFAQVNRDGLTSEETNVVAGSDRIGWLCSHLSLLKLKSPEEIGSDGPDLGDRKLVVQAARHGAGHRGQNYVHIGSQLQYSRLEELGSTVKPKKSNKKFEVPDVEDLQF